MRNVAICLQGRRVNCTPHNTFCVETEVPVCIWKNHNERVSAVARFNRPFRNFGKGTGEGTAHSDSLGKSRNWEIPSASVIIVWLAFSVVASPCKLELFSIYLHFSRVA